MEYFRLSEDDIIASISIECVMPDKKIFFHLPKPETDPIKLIITTFYKIVDGLPVFLDKSVIKIDPKIIQCSSEKEMILKWSEMIKNMNEDKKVINSEKEMILKWLKLIRNKKTTVIMAWNLFNFEYDYLEGRAKQLGILDTFSKLATINYEYIGKQKECKQKGKCGRNVWIKKYDPSNITLLDVMPYVQSISGVLGKMFDLAEHYGLEIPEFSGYFGCPDKELAEYSLKTNMLHVDLFFKAYQKIATSKKLQEGLEEMQQFIEDNKQYIDDTDPVFFNSNKYIRNKLKDEMSKLTDAQKNEFSL